MTLSQQGPQVFEAKRKEPRHWEAGPSDSQAGPLEFCCELANPWGRFLGLSQLCSLSVFDWWGGRVSLFPGRVSSRARAARSRVRIRMGHLTRVLSFLNPHRATSLIRNHHLVGPYSRTMPRLLWWC